MPRKVAGVLSVNCEIENYAEIKRKLDDLQKAPPKAMKALTGDLKRRVPGWVAAEVVKEYGIKKGQITGKKIGKVTPQGTNYRNVQIVYTGRLLTPTHFNMSPKAPKPGGGYTLKATIVKGKRATLGKVKKLTKKQRAALAKNFTRSGERTSDHSPIMLMHTGSAQEGGTSHIPFQRKSVRRNDVEAIKTVSLPQMVSSKRTETGIQQAIHSGLEKRLDHYLERYR